MNRRWSALVSTVTVAMILLLSGCMTPGKMNETLSSWVGDNANNLMHRGDRVSRSCWTEVEGKS